VPAFLHGDKISDDLFDQVWYGVVIRGDKNRIIIGPKSNIQDRSVLYCSEKLSTGFPSIIDIGSYVTVGHGVILNSCTIRDESLIGMGSVISEGSIIDRNSMVAAGSVVLPNTFIPSGQLWAGNPAKFIRNLTEEELAFLNKVFDYFLCKTSLLLILGLCYPLQLHSA